LTAVARQAQRLDTLTASFVLPHDSDLAITLRELRESSQLTRRSLDRAIAIVGAGRAPSSSRASRPATKPLDFETVLVDALKVPMFRFDDRIIECALEVDQGLRVHTEAAAWHQVISNLVANSVLHGFIGKAEGGRISVSASRSGADRVCVVFRDDGRGFSVRARANAFARAHSTRPDAASSGLGLSLIRDIVRDRLHGTISLLDSHEGAALSIEFPARPPA